MEKPKIQYVGQFYVHGSEAPKLEPKKPQRRARTSLPLERLRRVEKIYLDPVAAVAIAAALMLMVTMLVGALRLKNDWLQYEKAQERLDTVSQENARLDKAYHASFDEADIQRKAEALGLIPVEEITVRRITVTVPEPEPEEDPFTAWVEHVRWFWNGLWA